MVKLTKSLSLLVVSLLILASTLVASSDFRDIESDIESLGFKVSVFSIGDWNFTIIWFSREPDLVIEYCGKNMIYYKPYITLMVREVTGDVFEDPEEVVMRRISKYVGPRVNMSDPLAVAEENERRMKIGEVFNKAFLEEANGKALGLLWVSLVPFFEWDPPAISIALYFGSKSFKEKEDTVKRLLQNPHIASLLKSYNVSYIIVWEADSLKGAGELVDLVTDLLHKAYWDKISVPESIKSIVKAGMIVGGSMLGSLSININATTPDIATIEEFVKWIRDNVKHCDVPIVITFNDIIAGMKPVRLPTLPAENKVKLRESVEVEGELRDVVNNQVHLNREALIALLMIITLILLPVVYFVCRNILSYTEVLKSS